MVALIVVAVVVVVAVVIASRAIRIIPQARAAVLERLGRYHRTLEPGCTLITPFIDRVRPLIDLREQVVNFSPQPVITAGQRRRRDRDGPVFPRSPTRAPRRMRSRARCRRSSS